MSRRVAFTCLVIGLGCSEPGPPPVSHYKPTPLDPLVDVQTTVDRMFVPLMPILPAESGKDPALPDALTDYLNRGFGDLVITAGEPYQKRVIDDSSPPPVGPNAHRLVRFAHLADLQIGDDESPTRVGLFDGAGPTAPALRPQDAYLCRMASSAVRTINAMHAKDPFAFTLMGGDNADSAQTNELEWALGILSGSPSVECDSGNDDDIVLGPDNDGKNPFVADGLKMPWKWVTGNHDVLVQGNLRVSENRERVLGTDSTGGTRRYNGGRNGLVSTGKVVVADPKRALLSPVDLLTKVAADGDGHGIATATAASGHATYTFDVDGTPLRFLVIDTAHPNGASEGVIQQGEIDRVIRPALDKAKADGKWVMLASHHATTNLTDGGGVGGQAEADALTADAWRTFVGGYDNVIFSFVGHAHRHRISPIKPTGGHAWWEVMTAAIADWPHQFRTIEIYDQDNGWLMLRATCMDLALDFDPVAAEGKRRGVVDLTAGWLPTDTIDKTDRNVEIWIKRP